MGSQPWLFDRGAFAFFCSINRNGSELGSKSRLVLLVLASAKKQPLSLVFSEVCPSQKHQRRNFLYSDTRGRWYVSRRKHAKYTRRRLRSTGTPYTGQPGEAQPVPSRYFRMILLFCNEPTPRGAHPLHTVNFM